MTEHNPGTPWGIEADILMRERGWSKEKARDVVIAKWLRAGDTKALGALLELGHAPGPGVLNFLARMLQHESLDTAKDRDEVPFRLVAQSRTGQRGRPLDPEIAVRDRLLALQVEKRVSAGVTKEAAVADVVEMLDPNDADFKAARTVDEAHKRRSGRKARQPSIDK